MRARPTAADIDTIARHTVAREEEVDHDVLLARQVADEVWGRREECLRFTSA